jgi:adenylate kinase family enzyme
MSSTRKPDVVFVLGAPGAGKGTQCENIVKVRFCTECSYPVHYDAYILEYL